MTQNISYSIWMTIAISHSFFDVGRCNLGLEPTSETALILQRSGILFRKQDTHTWILLQPVGEEALSRTGLFFEEHQVLLFNMKPLSTDFYFYTQSEIKTIGDCSCMHIGRNGIFAQLAIPVSKDSLSSRQHMDIICESKMRFWEFILIPKFNTQLSNILLNENKNRLVFTCLEKVTLPGEQQPVWRFVSEQELQLKEKYHFRICLWDVQDTGRRLLCSHIPYPQPGSVSIFSPDNMITNYFYF
ncbi:MAG: hypothetical protein H6Q17_428 [Bacteroidetes bacterium]|nr:hypothetical protein [Bacteroidota bacterium]